MTTTTDAPPLAGMDLYYGLWVTSVGDDGNLLVAGHHPLMRTVAAMNAYSRHVIGLANLADDRVCALADIAPAVEQQWATKQTHADCAARATDGPGHQCDMCNTLDDGGWWITVHKDERPGSFPVTWMAA